MKSEKELFFEKIRPYMEKGLLRKVCDNDHFAFMSVGERLYVACPYIMFDDIIPYGIHLNTRGLMILANDNMRIYSMSLNLLNNVDKYQELLFLFAEDRIGFWKNWIAENKNVNKIDYSLEKKFIKIQNKKS